MSSHASSRHKRFRFQKTLLASLIGTALMPHGAALAIDLSQSPPSASAAGAAPNVILSLDDSGSMEWSINGKGKSGAKRENILKDALQSVFNDKSLVPDGSMRLLCIIIIKRKT